MELKNLFSPEKIGNVQIKNRIVRSATWEARASEDGQVTDQLIEMYDELAKGGSGLIIPGYTAVHPGGAATRCMTRLYDDKYIPGQKKLVGAVHEYSDVKIACQIAHTGAQAFDPQVEAVGPSVYLDTITNRTSRELTNAEIKEISKSFVDAGERAYTCGYDIIQLHVAHGYLLSDFVSTFANKRDDEYGGTRQKRIKLVLEIFNELRDKLGKDYPLIAKLNSQDFLQDGMSLDEGVELAKILVDVGIDAIEPSSGRVDTKFTGGKFYASYVIKSEEDENFFLPNMKAINPFKKDSKMILMGGIRKPESAEKFLQEGVADFISMCRPLIREPDLPNRWESGDLSPAQCISCNGCLTSGFRYPVHCVVKKKLERKKAREQKKKQ